MVEYIPASERDDIVDGVREKHGLKKLAVREGKTFRKVDALHILSRFGGQLVVVDFEEVEVLTQNSGLTYTLNHVSSNGSRIPLCEYLSFERARAEFECIHTIASTDFGTYTVHCE